jgi:hypothetical protein
MFLPNAFDLRTALRRVISKASGVLPRATGISVERKFRGYEDAKKVERAEGVVISFGKSGRTWLRLLIWRYLARKHGLPSDTITGFDEFHNMNRGIPVLFFTHDNYLKDFAGHDRKFDLYGKQRVVLMVRDPRDTAVSQYFQWKHRIVARKRVINGYPLDDTDVHGFITGEAAGIPKIIDFMNAWARDLERFPNLLVVKYEDLRADTKRELARVLTFFGQKPTEAELEDSTAFASIENMRRMEQENAGKLTVTRSLKPADASDPSSYKVRRAKVGGWRDYVTAEQAEAIDKMVKERLSPVFGYA